MRLKIMTDKGVATGWVIVDHGGGTDLRELYEMVEGIKNRPFDKFTFEIEPQRYFFLMKGQP